MICSRLGVVGKDFFVHGLSPLAHNLTSAIRQQTSRLLNSVCDRVTDANSKAAATFDYYPAECSGEQNCPRPASQPAFCYLPPQARQSVRPLANGCAGGICTHGSLVAAVLAAVVVFRPGCQEAFFPWLTIIAMSSVLLVFALSMGSQLTFTKLSPYMTQPKKLYSLCPTCS